MINSTQQLIDITIPELLARVQGYADKNARLVQINCTKTPEGLEINYSFDLNFAFENLKIKFQSGTNIPSVSNIYWCAMLYENEIHDLFGVVFDNICLDFRGTFYRIAQQAPFLAAANPTSAPASKENSNG